MSLSICTECLLRLKLSSSAPRGLAVTASTWTQTTSFHSSAAQYKSPLLKKKVPQAKPTVTRARQSQSARLKKKSRERPKLPPVGERRAQRRRIILSNTNALPVSDVETWSKENMVDEKSVGHMMALDGGLLDQLRDSGAFKTTQNWGLFRRPATLIREETLRIAKDMESVKQEGDKKKVVKHLVIGEKASGKSILMLQAMGMAYMDHWIVLNVPEAQDFVNNTSSYAPLRHAEDESEHMYIQPHLTQLLLTRIAASNESVLKSLRLNHAHPKPLSLKNNSTLLDLAQKGAGDHHLSWQAWQALYKELTEPGQHQRPPVLVAADGVDHWMGPTAYRDSEHKILHSHQFMLVKQFINFLFTARTSNTSPFINGGMVLYSTSGSNTPAYPTFDLVLSQMRAVQVHSISPAHPDFPLPKPYSKPDPRVLALSAPATRGDLNLLELKGLNRLESRGYLEYFAKSGLLHKRITDGLVSEMRGLSGGGVVGELARLSRRVIA
ncbi:uncharacterized protein Z520_06637 [Fonsecaea multimorphosa CBS 102226]|uniref:Small ribosomal subunit protein mS29 n=1 Tax=Fonsecaea multimorphosa CBS 102226 TaxID=1442371 RepID=A0A0D2K3V7_9EURO|nr:uncharacterized protein Z520_06637 [Fonsecaea multimorphosa CBS 102226]KIX97859.1 hypothetical protein Z520_06637 [Fonsecaea multimorphosa CBS 102226]OAL23627.1 hypothetical protein AYO22_06204 [Fonsecaea multimorphosa]